VVGRWQSKPNGGGDKLRLSLHTIIETELGRCFKSKCDRATELPELDGLWHSGKVRRDRAAADDTILRATTINAAARISRDACGAGGE
jgi:hypothetical protein